MSQFTADIRNISGQNNVVAEAHSRVESVTEQPSYDEMALRKTSTTRFEHS
jgi:hypothetical protein